MTEDDVQEVLGRLSGGLMDYSGINLEMHEWHAAACFLAKNGQALVDLDRLVRHIEKTEPTYRAGFWTPQGRVLCQLCVTPVQEGPPTRKVDGYGVTSCMQCATQITVREDVADLNNLRMALPRGWYPRLEQTGGMTCNLYMDVAGHEYMVSDNDQPHHSKFTVDWFPDSVENSDISHHIGLFDTPDEIIMAVTKYRFRFGAQAR